MAIVNKIVNAIPYIENCTTPLKGELSAKKRNPNPKKQISEENTAFIILFEKITNMPDKIITIEII